MNANHIDATAIRCSTSVQQNFNCNVGTLMSMMSEKGFEHHVVMTQASSAPPLAEAFGNDFGWDANEHEHDS